MPLITGVENLRIKFLYGHILEELIILFSVLAGHEVTEAQKEVHVEGIKGHQDCKIDGVLVDCKSASLRGFDKFRDRIWACISTPDFKKCACHNSNHIPKKTRSRHIDGDAPVFGFSNSATIDCSDS